MPLTKPYFRCWRPNLGREGRSNLYIYDPRYVENPGQHLRSVEILYNDLRAALDYIEPADANNAIYSFRLRDLLMRICTEIEAEFKEILAMNSYSKGTPDKWDMRDFYQLNATHHLSSYELQIPYWNGTHKNRIPFSSWHNQLTYKSLPWYKAYNSVKHNRFTAFPEASLGNVIDAFSGLLILLAAEFHDADCLKPIDISYVLGDDSGYHDGYEDSIGSPFRVKRPQDWTDDEKYNIDWQVIKDTEHPFDYIYG